MRRHFFVAIALAVTLALGATGAVQASSHLLDPFTADELANNWQADRLYPSGGVESVSFDGRDHVAQISMDSSQASGSGSWWGYEGIKKVDDFGTAVQVDLYVPSGWQDIPVNAGFWASDDPITAYPIIAYRNSGTVPAGFYTWQGDAGWLPSGVPVVYDGWNTFSITLDTVNDTFLYAINGAPAGGLPASSDTIGQVFLNQYNYGGIDPVNAVDYDVHWQAGVEAPTDPTTKDDCKNGGWADFGFRNQGKCIQFVNTGRDSR